MPTFGKKSCFCIKSQAILCNPPVSAFVSYELITSNKKINDSDEYLDFMLEPNNERELWSRCDRIFTETETVKVNNAQLNRSVVRNKSSPRKDMPKRSPTETLKELHSHSKKDKNISWKVSKQVKNVTRLCEVLS